MKLFKVLCIFALVLGFTAVASAEVQNIKVSGDLGMYSFWRNDYDLNDKDRTVNEAQNWFMTIAELQVDADLTDNVATCIRLFNQREWDDKDPEYGSDDQYKVEIDLAYIVLKEMLYSPLTLTVGRQDLWLGDGLVVGAKFNDPQTQIIADEYSAMTSFDAIKATLDYDPWTINLIYSKIEENTNTTGGTSHLGNNDDADLWVANVGYVFDSYNAEAEAYYVYLHDRTNMNTAAGTEESTANTVDCLGIRGSFDPVEQGTIKAEAALQLGDFCYDGTNTQRDREAYAIDLTGEYRFDDVRWSPKVTVEYLYLSGEMQDASTDTDDWEGWHQLYTGKRTLAIRQWQNVFYDLDHRGATNMNDMLVNADQDSGISNAQMIMISGEIYPTESLTIGAKYGNVQLAEKVSESNTDKGIGDEIDITLTYDYTEDVTFGLLAAWFFPGNFFPADQDDNAVDVVGSLNVSF